MSKIRIYELAKELGVDNRVIIEKANELSKRGKISHSHSLDGDEADAIRRAILRQAMGQGAPINTESVKTRVDRVTGATDTVVERRQGDVIRRRRHAEAGESGVVSRAETPGGGTEMVSHDDGGTRGADVHIPAATAELEEGGAARIVEGSAAVEVAHVSEVEEAAEVVEEGAAEGVVAEEALEEHVADTAEVAPSTDEVTSVVAAEVPPQSVVGTGAAPSPAIGPKILGRIELPQRRVVVKPAPEAKRPVRAGTKEGAPAVVVEEEEGPRKGLKKGRKREISGEDLLDYGGREVRRGRPGRGKMGSDRHGGGGDTERPKVAKRVIELGDSITVGELARQMSLKAGEVIAKLLGLGVMATINQTIDKDTANIVADELGYEVKHTEFNEQDIIQDVAEEDPSSLRPRPPVVTVMGHVDHGKTSLLDRIRSASVAAKEAGGITQHIGAYTVQTPDGRTVTFIDTPGHAAFTSMRARGAQVTDIVVLVVAADDGVMPQTREAINHAQAAKVPIVVAINKMDKADANPEKIRSQLAEYGLQPEDWGGDTMFFPVSALKGDGIEALLEGIAVLAEVRELKANPDRRAKGTIIESRQERGRGVVATVLVQAGTLRVGDIFVSGSEYGRVRTMNDHNGVRVEEVGPSTPVEITGLNGMPDSGDDFFVVESEADAREVAGNRTERKEQQARALFTGPISLEEFAKRASNQAALELNVILKADVQGSVEAVRQAIEKLSGEKVKVRVLHSGVGGVTESDVQLAVASSAIIIGFGVRAEPRAAAEAEQAGVELRFYRVIYELIDDVRSAMAGLLEPVKQESNLGRVEVRDTFSVPKVGTIAGCYVTGGIVRRGSYVRLLRDSKVIYEGKLGSLRRFKEDVREVQAGFECGIGIEGFNDIKVGDVMEIYEIKEIAATLE